MFLNETDLLKRWLKSGISAKEFLHKNRGSITGKNLDYENTIVRNV